jgi:hypothetical protein
MREETTSRVMAVDRPYGEFYDFYSVSSEYFGHHNIKYSTCGTKYFVENNICPLKKKTIMYMTVRASKGRDWVFCNKNHLVFMEIKLLF